MAISAVHYQLLKAHAHLFKRGGSLLEIGEANWYGDIDPRTIIDDAEIPSDPDGRMHAENRRNGMRSIIHVGNMFAIAKLAYRVLWSPSIVHAVDMNGTPDAMRQDLNAPLNLAQQYDTIINHGTAEHIFNIAQVFASIHDACKLGGYMIHECPFTGWPDHGFYTIQPTLFYDLAAANRYELVSISMADIQSRTICRLESREHCHAICRDKPPMGLILFVVMHKVVAGRFCVPMQGYYDGRLTPEGIEAWHDR